MRFEISLYDNAGATECARYCVGKHAHGHDLWIAAGGDLKRPFEAWELASFKEPDSFTKLVDERRDEEAQKRFVMLRSLQLGLPA